MPRRYYRRRTIVRAPRKKWASNIRTINYRINKNDSGAGKIPWTTLVTNAVQSAAPTPTILKAGNFKVNADFEYSLSAGGTITPHLVAFVLFMPEGIAPADNQQFGNLITAHPEYIMAWRQLDTEWMPARQDTAAGSFQRVTFSSRLKRNLNSGDSIVFGLLDQTAVGVNQIDIIRVQLTCQYWTCSN